MATEPLCLRNFANQLGTDRTRTTRINLLTFAQLIFGKAAFGSGRPFYWALPEGPTAIQQSKAASPLRAFPISSSATIRPSAFQPRLRSPAAGAAAREICRACSRQEFAAGRCRFRNGVAMPLFALRQPAAPSAKSPRAMLGGCPPHQCSRNRDGGQRRERMSGQCSRLTTRTDALPEETSAIALNFPRPLSSAVGPSSL